MKQELKSWLLAFFKIGKVFAKAVLLITAKDEGLSPNETGQLYNNVELSGSVENTGVESEEVIADLK